MDEFLLNQQEKQVLVRLMRRLEDGKFQLLRAEDVFNDYQFSKDHMIKLPERKTSTASEISLAAA